MISAANVTVGGPVEDWQPCSSNAMRSGGRAQPVSQGRADERHAVMRCFAPTRCRGGHGLIARAFLARRSPALLDRRRARYEPRAPVPRCTPCSFTAFSPQGLALEVAKADGAALPISAPPTRAADHRNRASTLADTVAASRRTIFEVLAILDPVAEWPQCANSGHRPGFIQSPLRRG
jgi:hypothetical protein